jgi:hypothetical protein
MSTRIRRFRAHRGARHIPQGTGNSAPPPPLNQIKEEPKPKVSEPLKQEESRELSMMPDEEQPDCYGDLDRPNSVDVAREI